MAKVFTPRQQNWIWYQNNAAEPSVAIGTENNKPTLPDGSIIRLRVSVAEIGGANGANEAWALEYSLNDTDWVSFGAANHWNYADGLATEGNTISGHLTSDGDTLGLYYESGTYSNLLGKSTIEESDFAIQQTANASDSTDYYFRVTIGGAEVPLNSGETHPVLTTAAGATVYNFADTLALTSNTADAKINRVFAFADTLALTSNTADAKLYKLVDFADALGLTSLTGDAKLTKIIDFADALGLTSLTGDAALTTGAIVNFADTLNLTSLTADAKLNLIKDFADTLALTSLTGDAKLNLIKDFADILALTSLTGDAVLSGLTVDFSDTLNLTSLTGDAKLTRIIDFLDTLDLTSLTGDAILSGLAIDFAATLALTSLTADGELAIGVWIQDPVELYRWDGVQWVAADGLSWIP